MMKNIRYLFFLCLIANVVSAQNEFSNSVEFGFSLGLGAPFADLADRAGLILSGNASLNYFQDANKFSIELGFLSSDNVREDPLSSFRTSSGFILSDNGVVTPITTRLVGTYIGFQYSRILNRKKDSRVKLYAGLSGGVLQHQINFLELSNSVPIIMDDYKLGINRNSIGPYLSQSIGMRVPTTKMKIEVELFFKEAFTNQKRELNIDNLEINDNLRNDIMIGLISRWYISFRSVEKGKDKFY